MPVSFNRADPGGAGKKPDPAPKQPKSPKPKGKGKGKSAGFEIPQGAMLGGLIVVIALALVFVGYFFLGGTKTEATAENVAGQVGLPDDVKRPAKPATNAPGPGPR